MENDSKIYSKTFVFSPFQENTYVLYNTSGEAIVIDPGMQNREEEEEISRFINDNNLHLKRIILTHAHIDHVFGLNYLAEKYQLKVGMHPESIDVLRSVPDYAGVYGFEFSLGDYDVEVIEEGEKIELGLDVLYVPGHVPGHLVFYKKDQSEMWVGDVLFSGSIGRTDLPGGDHDLLISGIKTKLLPLDGNIVVHSGHGPDTTIGFEKLNNPFLQG